MPIKLSDDIKKVLEDYLRNNPAAATNDNRKTSKLIDDLITDIATKSIRFGITLTEQGNNNDADKFNKFIADLLKKDVYASNRSVYQINKQILIESYRKIHSQNKLLTDKIKQYDIAHLKEQGRLALFRTVSAMGIAIALIFMGLLANQMGVQIGLPLFRTL